MLIDSGADVLLYGNAERAIVELTHALSQGRQVSDLTDLRGTTLVRAATPAGWTEIDSTRIDWPGQIDVIPNPYDMKETDGTSCEQKKPTTAMT